MCGICGIVGLQGQPLPHGRARVSAMVQTLHHRGPDGQGSYDAGMAVLGHARLKIIDLAGGAQPLANEDERIWVTFNGEIFNYVELRTDLIARGHQFRTQSDTEVLVHAYEAFGDEFVHRLNGQFAFAIWDERRQRLLAARDRPGIAPFFYERNGGEFRFASEIKALLAVRESRPELNVNALIQIATYWSAITPHTAFEGIEELPPGHLLTVEQGHMQVRPYWNWSFPPESELRHAPVPEIAEEFQALLNDATRLRLRADVPVGGYLSGGIDSSTILSLMHDQLRDCDAYSLEFAREDLNEAGFQRQVAQALGVRRHSIQIRDEDLARDLADVIRHTEAPLVRLGPVPMQRLSGLVRSFGNKVVLTGEGADEVLGGYDIFKEAKLRAFVRRNPDSAYRSRLLTRLYPYLNLSGGQDNAFLRSFFASPGSGPLGRYDSHLARWRVSAWSLRFLNGDLKARIPAGPEADLDALIPAGYDDWAPFCQAQWLEARVLMNGYILAAQGDRMLLRHGVEGRFPFLDHRLIEFANNLHPVYKMPGLAEKTLLKRLMRNRLPANVLRRPKQPYRASGGGADGPLGMRRLYEHHLSSDQLNKSGVFDSSAVRKLLGKVQQQATMSFREESALTWMLTTQLWHEQFIEGWKPAGRSSAS